MRSNTACLVAIVFVSLSSNAQDIGNQLKWGRPAYPRGGACFFQRQNYGGNYFCMANGEMASSLPRGFNDRISSVRIFGNATASFYNDRNFRRYTPSVDEKHRRSAKYPRPGQSLQELE